MHFFYNVLIFLIVLFVYIHLTQQLKTGEDLEIYEMDYSSNTQLQEVCDVKQPVLFDYNHINPEFIENIQIDELLQTGSHDVHIKTIQEYWESGDSIDFVGMPMQSAHNLIMSDTQSKFFSEENGDYIEDAGYQNSFATNDEFLKPTATLSTNYDLLFGSTNVTTPLRYHNDYRHFMCVHSGKISIKMTPYKNHKFLHVIKDYDNYEFRSAINVWNIQPQFKKDIEKVKFIDFDIHPGFVLYIPPFWFYSIKFVDDKTIASSITYKTIMNYVATIPELARYYIQQTNIQKKVARTLELEPEETSPIVVEESISDTL
jgi:hypothetical protein